MRTNGDGYKLHVGTTHHMTKFSIICVYNNNKLLSNFLEEGLGRQQYTDYEKIFIDNRSSTYTSAASALNTGAKDANGEYYVFVHQDVKLPPQYLTETKKYLDNLENIGVVGAAGARETGCCSREVVTNIQHGDPPYQISEAINISRPTEVNTLDEQILIIPQDVFHQEPFSEKICQGWHLYGVEYSIRMNEQNKKVVVLPIKLWHRSDGGWRDWRHDITMYRIIRSYPNIDCIHTTGPSVSATRLSVIKRLSTNIPIINLPVRFMRYFKEG